MLKIGVLIGALCLSFVSGATCAQDMVAAGLNPEITPIAKETSSNAKVFDNQTENLGSVKELTPPECSSTELYDKVMNIVNDYSQKVKAETILAKRKQALLPASISGFHKVPTQGFNTTTDFNTANALLMIKINEKVLEDDILICEQNGKHNTPLFLIIYPYSDNYKVYVINLDRWSDDYKDISFIYP